MSDEGCHLHALRAHFPASSRVLVTIGWKARARTEARTTKGGLLRSASNTLNSAGILSCTVSTQTCHIVSGSAHTHPRCGRKRGQEMTTSEYSDSDMSIDSVLPGVQDLCHLQTSARVMWHLVFLLRAQRPQKPPHSPGPRLGIRPTSQGRHCPRRASCPFRVRGK